MVLDLTDLRGSPPPRYHLAIFCAAVAVLLSLVAPPEARADPAKVLREAARTYARGRYKRVIKHVRPLLYPKIVLSDQGQVIRAHRLLALSYIFLKEKMLAEKHCLEILSLRPQYKLDPVVDPVAAVELFDEVKRRNAARIKAILDRERAELERKRLAEQKRREAERKKKLEALLAKPKNERVIEERYFVVNLLPLGAGQFQNGHNKKGWALLGTQAGLGAVSLGLYLGLTLSYSNGQVPADEWETVEALRYTQVITGAACLALVAYGIIDALAYYKPETVTVRPIQQAPAKEKSPNAEPAEQKSTWYLTPSLGPESAGLGFGLRF